MVCQAVIFDLFHTLTSLEVSGAPGRWTADVLGIDREVWSQHWMSDPDDYVLGLSEVSVPVRRIARSLNPDVTEEQVQAAVAERYGRFRHALLNIEPEVISGLGRLRVLGFKLGLVSNCGSDEVRDWQESPLASLLDTAVFSCEVKFKKPDPRIFELAAGRLGVAPGNCLFVGNGGSQELSGTRNAGMTPVLLTRHLEAIRPERIPEMARDAAWQVRTVTELAGMLTSGHGVLS
jgi:putative hydrolase of the HAD superfamily